MSLAGLPWWGWLICSAVMGGAAFAIEVSADVITKRIDEGKPFGFLGYVFAVLSKIGRFSIVLLWLLFLASIVAGIVGIEKLVRVLW